MDGIGISMQRECRCPRCCNCNQKTAIVAWSRYGSKKPISGCEDLLKPYVIRYRLSIIISHRFYAISTIVNYFTYLSITICLPKPLGDPSFSPSFVADVIGELFAACKIVFSPQYRQPNLSPLLLLSTSMTSLPQTPIMPASCLHPPPTSQLVHPVLIITFRSWQSSDVTRPFPPLHPGKHPV